MKNKIFNISYNFFCKLYSFFIFNYEHYFIKKNKNITNQNNNLLTKGFCVEKLNNLKAFDFTNNKIEKVNKYMSKFILTEKDIQNLIYKIFVKYNLKKLISLKTGYSYSIDYLIAYKTFQITNDEKNKKWYANHWHYDKPFSPNTLKVILPLKSINDDQGGLELLSIDSSKKIKDYVLKEDQKPEYKMVAQCDEVLIFLPNLSLHRAGQIEEKGYSREQLMFQLNPSKSWKINNKLFYKQKKTEPKFPIFSYFFDQYSSLNYSS